MYNRRRRYPKHSNASPDALRHVEERKELSRLFGGIDREIEKVFLSLPQHQLAPLLESYKRTYGIKAHDYAVFAMPKWKSGSVKMSGMVAERLLNLLPPILDYNTRFELIKTLRTRHMPKRNIEITGSIDDWTRRVEIAISELIKPSQNLQLPNVVLEKAKWLSAGDNAVAMTILSKIETEDGLMKLEYFRHEFQHINNLIQSSSHSKTIRHTISLPAGNINLSVHFPSSGILARILNLFR